MCFPLCSAHIMIVCTQTSKDLPLLLLVLLASAASSRAVTFGDSASAADVRGQSVQDFLALRAQIIKSLQSAIEEGPGSDKEDLIVAIVLLCGLESAVGNTKAAEAHARGLQMIVAMLGGLDALSHTTVSLLIFADLVAGMTSNVPPMFQIPPQWEKEVFTDSNLLAKNKYLTRNTVLGTAFFTSPWSHVIPLDLADIIRSLQQLIPYHEQNIKMQSHSVLENDYLVLVSRQLLAPSFKARLNPFQETIRISICLYSMTRIWSFPRKPCTLNLVRMLRESLKGCLGLFQTTAPEFLFWMFFLSCLASRGTGDFAWAAHGLKYCAEQLSVFEWYSALPIMEKFFFVLRESDVAKDVWDEVQYVKMKSAITENVESCQTIQDRH
ncbi:hypothetical protein N7513_009234 [Penicillium frequentans]|nr:hypothetical protein N7513_009234 [Penicillium glabrum]